MAAYTLRVLQNGSPDPLETAYCEQASEVFGLAGELLAAHSDCHSIWVGECVAHHFTIDRRGDVVAA